MPSPSLQEINTLLAENFTGLLGITVCHAEPGLLRAMLPVTPETMRPGGYMHGGVNLVFAETLAGLGSALLIDRSRFESMGIQVSANHVASVREGVLLAKATIVHQGRSTHIWNIDIRNTTPPANRATIPPCQPPGKGESPEKNGRAVSLARVTNMIVKKR